MKFRNVVEIVAIDYEDYDKEYYAVCPDDADEQTPVVNRSLRQLRVRS